MHSPFSLSGTLTNLLFFYWVERRTGEKQKVYTLYTRKSMTFVDRGIVLFSHFFDGLLGKKGSMAKKTGFHTFFRSSEPHTRGIGRYHFCR